MGEDGAAGPRKTFRLNRAVHGSPHLPARGYRQRLDDVTASVEDDLVVHVHRHSRMVRNDRNAVADVGPARTSAHVDVAVLLVQRIDLRLRVLDE